MRGGAARYRVERRGFAAFAARLGLVLAALALLAQSLAFAAPMREAPGGAAAAAAELTALLGTGVLVCTQGDATDPPAPSTHGCDQCPLCRLAADALALALPAPPEFFRPAPAVVARLTPAPPPLALPTAAPPSPWPRGPPSET